MPPRRCSTRAIRLDPQLESVERNLAELVVRRRRQPTPPAGRRCARRSPSSRVGPWTSPRAPSPPHGLRLSLCMIVRDEQEMLPRCLAAVAGAVDEIVIVDTGSSDATIEIARSFGARVIEREWRGSFARGPQRVLRRGRRRLADVPRRRRGARARGRARLLRSLTARTWREAFYLSETNYTGDAGRRHRRHAQRAARVPQPPRVPLRGPPARADRPPPARATCPSGIEATSVRVEHYGYLGVVRDGREKSRRNIELLRLQQAESAADAVPALQPRLRVRRRRRAAGRARRVRTLVASCWRGRLPIATPQVRAGAVRAGW